MNHAIHTAVRRARNARIATSTALAAALSIVLLTLSVVPAQAGGIDATINSITAPAAVWVGKVVFFKIPLFGAQLPLVVLWLVVGAVYFTWYMKFVNLRGFRHAIELARGDYADPKSAGEVSHFQALATAVSGTVGIGNIGGVAVAVTVGGAGATFWLILAGFLGMSTKFVECTLGVKYRNENPDGSVSGGPMYYLRKGFEDRGMAQFGRYIGGFYAVGIFVGAYGLMFRLIRTRAATRVSALQYFAPPVTMLIAWPVFGEALTINGLAGLLVTSAGFWLMARGAAKRG